MKKIIYIVDDKENQLTLLGEFFREEKDVEHVLWFKTVPDQIEDTTARIMEDISLRKDIYEYKILVDLCLEEKEKNVDIDRVSSLSGVRQVKSLDEKLATLECFDRITIYIITVNAPAGGDVEGKICKELLSVDGKTAYLALLDKPIEGEDKVKPREGSYMACAYTHILDDEYATDGKVQAFKNAVLYGHRKSKK